MECPNCNSKFKEISEVLFRCTCGATLEITNPKQPLAEQSEHPLQPLLIDSEGVMRFKKNPIVAFLLDAGPYDMNKLALMPWEQDDREQFAQLLGYSLGGFNELPYVSDATCERANRGRNEVES